MVDADGFRPNVGIVLSNDRGQVLWARRVGGQDHWQFPQGGINSRESVEEALFRELYEEVGLNPGSVEILARTRGWLRWRRVPTGPTPGQPMRTSGSTLPTTAGWRSFPTASLSRRRWRCA